MTRVLHPLLLGLLAALGVAALLSSPARGDDAAQAGEARPDDPHAHPQRCAACHEPVSRGTRAEDIPFVGGHPDAMCSSCHDTAHHEVGISAHRRGDPDPDPDKARVPPSFPLVDGTLSCISCHDEPACDGNPRHERNPLFFRGGPYATMGALCNNCHAAAREVRFDPHTAMKEKAETTAICEFCHDQPGDEVEREALLASLKVEASAICHGCHKDTRHAGTVEHLQYLDEAMAAKAEAAGLPLTPDRRVYCATCHDPHPAGSKQAAEYRVDYVGQPLITDETLWGVLEPLLSERAEALGTDLHTLTAEADFLRLPLRGNKLCKSCHDVEQIETYRRRKP